MLDIRLIRENPDFVRKNLELRQDSSVLNSFDNFLKLDSEWRKIKSDSDSLKSKRNDLTGEVKSLIASKKDASSLIADAKIISDKIKSFDSLLSDLDEKRNSILMSLPNLLDSSVPFGKDDSENKVLSTFGNPPKFSFPPLHHGELASKLNGADFERAVKISGEGFYFLKGNLALLNMALVNFSISKLVSKNFQLVIPPYFLRKKFYSGVVDISDFEDVMYKVENEDYYLIATSEHPLTAMYANDFLSSDELPILLCGYSMNFRKEIGKHGLDERGLFRLHQFDKVEQIVFSHPDESSKWFEKMVGNAREIVEEINIPHRVVATCTGDIGTVASIKNDIECWSPRENKYFETHSISNCTTYQSIRSNIKFKSKNGEKEFVHTLNGTAVAIPRMLRAILENYQTSDGFLKIPDVLQPYMGGLKEINL